MFYETLITIMKKNIWIWALAAVTLVTACSKNDDPVTPEPEQNVTEDDFESPDGQVVIQLGAGDYTASASTTVTRAPLTNDAFAKGGTIIGIYAVSTDGLWSEASNMLLNNRKAKVTETPRTEAEGADVSKKTDNIPAVTGPYKISLYDAEGGTEGQVEYYPMISDKNYAFYGYGPYDASNTAKIIERGATVTFDNFNGSQDIIWNKAEAPTIAAGDIYESQGVLTKRSISGYNAKYIRMLKYHKELNDAILDKEKNNYPWVPNIGFTHQLTQLKFQVVPAEKQSKDDRDAANELFVTGIKIKNHGTPTLDIVDGTITIDEKSDLSMLGVTNNTTFTDVVTNDNFHPVTPGTTVGYLMLAPAESYQLEVTVIPPSKDNLETPDQNNAQVVSLTLKPTTGTFEAGCSYNIKIGIYAMQTVEADASLTDWTDKGDVNIDVE